MVLKRFMPLCLLIAPYAFVGIVFVLCAAEGGLSANALSMAVNVYLAIGAVVFLPNMIYAFVARRRATARQLLFWDMMLKLCNIPIYLAVFLFGIMMALMILGIMLVPFLILFDYLLLLPSTMYGFSGLLQARREGRLSRAAMVGHMILHAFFCLDVVSAVVAYVQVRVKR